MLKIPEENVSEFANNANYATKGDNISEFNNDKGYITQVPSQVSPRPRIYLQQTTCNFSLGLTFNMVTQGGMQMSFITGTQCINANGASTVTCTGIDGSNSTVTWDPLNNGDCHTFPTVHLYSLASGSLQITVKMNKGSSNDYVNICTLEWS